MKNVPATSGWVFCGSFAAKRALVTPRGQKGCWAFILEYSLIKKKKKNYSQFILELPHIERCIKIALLWLYKYPGTEITKMHTQFKNKIILNSRDFWKTKEK